MAKLDLYTIRSHSFDPFYNISLEEAILDWIPENGVAFYLWQNENTVVIGRHQNVWKECRWQELEDDGGRLARRLSGGGAVYHDMGNLNFTFIAGKNHYNLHRQLKVLLEAVRMQDIHAEFSGRNDLTVDGQKFSGNAFHRNAHASLHHGTLLLNVDFSKLSRYLNPPVEKLRSKGVESVKARVINLSSLNPAITLDTMIDSLLAAFTDEYAGDTSAVTQLEVDQFTPEIEIRYPRFASWEWRFGKTPVFDITHSTRFPWGGIEMGFTLKDAEIIQADVFSDAMNAELIGRIQQVLQGALFKRDVIPSLIEKAVQDNEEAQVVNDIQTWLAEAL